MSGSRPVAGRPGRFGVTVIDFAMNKVYQNREPGESGNFLPALTTATLYGGRNG